MFNKLAENSHLLRLKVGTIICVALAYSIVVAAPAFADPPPWAPAWGYHGKNKGKNKHNNKYKYQSKNYAVPPAVPFGIGRGVCNRELLGSVLGATIGGVAGSQVGKGSGQLVGVAAGTIIGYLLGGNIGRYMDDIDQNCIGQALEHGEDGQEIVWNNPQNGAVYEVTPETTYKQASGEYCREYTAQSDINGRMQTTYGTACRQEDGSWKIKN